MKASAKTTIRSFVKPPICDRSALARPPRFSTFEYCSTRSPERSLLREMVAPAPAGAGPKPVSTGAARGATGAGTGGAAGRRRVISGSACTGVGGGRNSGRGAGGAGSSAPSSWISSSAAATAALGAIVRAEATRGVSLSASPARKRRNSSPIWNSQPSTSSSRCTRAFWNVRPLVEPSSTRLQRPPTHSKCAWRREIDACLSVIGVSAVRPTASPA